MFTKQALKFFILSKAQKPNRKIKEDTIGASSLPLLFSAAAYITKVHRYSPIKASLYSSIWYPIVLKHSHLVRVRIQEWSLITNQRNKVRLRKVVRAVCLRKSRRCGSEWMQEYQKSKSTSTQRAQPLCPLKTQLIAWVLSFASSLLFCVCARAF